MTIGRTIAFLSIGSLAAVSATAFALGADDDGKEAPECRAFCMVFDISGLKPGDIKRDPTALGIFDGIGQQVQENLLQTNLISHYPVRKRRTDLLDQLERLLPRLFINGR